MDPQLRRETEMKMLRWESYRHLGCGQALRDSMCLVRHHQVMAFRSVISW